MKQIKFKLWIATDKVGSKCETTVTLPERFVRRATDVELEKEMFELLCDSGMFEWNFEEYE